MSERDATKPDVLRQNPKTDETARETAARLRAELGIKLDPSAKQPLPRSFYDELSDQNGE